VVLPRHLRFRKKSVRRFILILAAALVVSVFAALLSQFLDRNVSSVYYPHDDARARHTATR